MKNYALTEIENTVQRSGKTLKQISGNASMVCRNVQQVGRRDELWSRSIKAGIVQLNQRWNDERKQIYYVVFESVEKQNFKKKKKGGLFLVQGHGGTEKTHTWKTIITKLHSDGKIMHAVTLSCKAQSQNSRVRDR